MKRSGRNYESEERRIEGRILISGVRRLSKRDVQAWLSKYGKIVDIVIFERYILVQFERESDANRAVGREKGETVGGVKFEIRYAHASDGSMSSRANLIRHTSPRNITHGHDSRDISPSYRDSDRGRSLERDRSYTERTDIRNSERSRISNEDNPRNIARSDISMNANKDINQNLQLVPTKVSTERHNFDAAIIIMSSDLLNYAETIDLKFKRQVNLTTHIIVLKEESHANPCIDDLQRKGVLYAFLINHINEKHSSCTLRILHGVGQEHRNMLLTNALMFVATNFEEYQKSNKDLASAGSNANFDPSRIPPGFVAPDDKIIYQLHLLADSRMLTIEELNEVDEFILKRINTLSQAEGVIVKPNGIPNDRIAIGQQTSLNVLPHFQSNMDTGSMLNPYVMGNEASLSANNPLPNYKMHHALDSLMHSQFRSDQTDQNNPYIPMNAAVGLNPNMHTMNINRVQNMMNAPLLRNMQPNPQYPNAYNACFQSVPTEQPMFRQRPPFQPRQHYPGY